MTKTFEEWYQDVKNMPCYKNGVPDICTTAYHVLEYAYGEGMRREKELCDKIWNKTKISCDECKKEISGSEVFVRTDGLAVCNKCADDMAGA